MEEPLLSQPAALNVTRRSRSHNMNMKDCVICTETKSEYRNFPTASTCDHDSNVCIECWERHIVTRVQQEGNKGFAACDCPSCGKPVSEEDIAGLLPRSVNREIQKLVKQTNLQAYDNWIWCPVEGCRHGALQNITNFPYGRCLRCKTKLCLRHQVPWHNGKTCDEYDVAHSTEEQQKDLETIRKTTKACPHCAMRIKKEGGCDYMRCTHCGIYFMWNSIAFDGEEIPTSAETAGEPDQGIPMPLDQREAVEAVMRFENNHGEAQIHRRGRQVRELVFEDDARHHGHVHDEPPPTNVLRTVQHDTVTVRQQIVNAAERIVRRPRDRHGIEALRRPQQTLNDLEVRPSLPADVQIRNTRRFRRNQRSLRRAQAFKRRRGIVIIDLTNESDGNHKNARAEVIDLTLDDD